MAYANEYKVNFYLTKFEKDHHYNGSTRTLDYTFVHGFPISITSMPVSYDQSQILKCNVSFSFIRYTVSRGFDPVSRIPEPVPATPPGIPQPPVVDTVPTFPPTVPFSPVIRDINGQPFPLGEGIPGLTGIQNPGVA